MEKLHILTNLDDLMIISCPHHHSFRNQERTAIDVVLPRMLVATILRQCGAFRRHLQFWEVEVSTCMLLIPWNATARYDPTCSAPVRRCDSRDDPGYHPNGSFPCSHLPHPTPLKTLRIF